MIPEPFDSCIPEVSDGFLFQETEDGVMLYESSTGKVITLDKSADLILSHCAEGLSVSQIADLLTDDSPIERDEVIRALAEFLEHGIIRTSVPPSVRGN